MLEEKSVIDSKSKEYIQSIVEQGAKKINRWQHEDTGRLVDMPVGKYPGRRWYQVKE